MADPYSVRITFGRYKNKTIADLLSSKHRRDSLKWYVENCSNFTRPAHVACIVAITQVLQQEGITFDQPTPKPKPRFLSEDEGI